MNGYYSVMLLGEALNRTDLRDLGRVMLAMEIRAARRYVHIITHAQSLLAIGSHTVIYIQILPLPKVTFDQIITNFITMYMSNTT